MIPKPQPTRVLPPSKVVPHSAKPAKTIHQFRRAGLHPTRPSLAGLESQPGVKGSEPTGSARFTFTAPVKPDIFDEDDLVRQIIATPCDCERSSDPNSLCSRRVSAAKSGRLLESDPVVRTKVILVDHSERAREAEFRRLTRLEIGDVCEPGPWIDDEDRYTPVSTINPSLYAIPSGERIIQAPKQRPSHYSTFAVHATLDMARSWPEDDYRRNLANQLDKKFVELRAFVHKSCYVLPALEGASSGSTRAVEQRLNFLELQEVARPGGNDEGAYSATIGPSVAKGVVRPSVTSFSTPGLDDAQEMYAQATQTVNGLVGDIGALLGPLVLMENETNAHRDHHFIAGTYTGGSNRNYLTTTVQINSTRITCTVATNVKAEKSFGKTLSSRFAKPHCDDDDCLRFTFALDLSKLPRGTHGGTFHLGLQHGLIAEPSVSNPSILIFHGDNLHSGTPITLPPPPALRRILLHDLTERAKSDSTLLVHLGDGFQTWIDTSTDCKWTRGMAIPYPDVDSLREDPPIPVSPSQALANSFLAGHNPQSYVPFLSERDGVEAHGHSSNMAYTLAVSAARTRAWATFDDTRMMMASALGQAVSETTVEWNEVFREVKRSKTFDFRETLKAYARLGGLAHLPILDEISWDFWDPDDEDFLRARADLQDTFDFHRTNSNKCRNWGDAAADVLGRRGWEELVRKSGCYTPKESTPDRPFDPDDIPLVSFDTTFLLRQQWYRNLVSASSPFVPGMK
ncbi:hypothetical protein RQP46_005832 [Phenoliferia psychrophenolica]